MTVFAIYQNCSSFVLVTSKSIRFISAQMLNKFWLKQNENFLKSILQQYPLCKETLDIDILQKRNW